jgi:hypothetical protein
VTTTKEWIRDRSQVLPRTGKDPLSALELPGKRWALTTLDVRTTGSQTYSSLCPSIGHLRFEEFTSEVCVIGTNESSTVRIVDFRVSGNLRLC